MESSNLRKPAVAGQFYSASGNRLRSEIELLVDKKAKAKEATACIMPHAGYMYSGKVAAATAASVEIKKRVIILGPNHTGYGKPFGIMTSGIWQEPFADVKIDSDLAMKLLKGSRYLEDDVLSHLYEHSLEVELPFLQFYSRDFEIVPISISTDEVKVYKEIGKEIAAVIKNSHLEESVLIVASSDMTHYEPQSSAQKKDKEAIQAILELDEDKLTQKVYSLGISMCGYAPCVITLVAAKLLGAKKGELIKYQTSGDVTGDYSSVVGYAGIVIY